MKYALKKKTYYRTSYKYSYAAFKWYITEIPQIPQVMLQWTPLF